MNESIDFSNLTQQGIDTLYNELKKTSKRNTAVSCHKITNNKSNLEWIVGNKAKFNKE